MTYSIVAHDPETGEYGAAVQSHYFAVGRRAIVAIPGLGAFASQASGDASHAPLLAEALYDGLAPQAALARVVDGDPQARFRQIAVVSSAGGAGYTGHATVPASGHAVGATAVAAGNMLTGPHWAAMLAAFESSEGPLEARLIAALRAAQSAGGDARGVMSAALKVAGAEEADYTQNGTRIDVRVDAGGDPIGELERLVELSEAHRRLTASVLSIGRLAGTGAAPIDAVTAPATLSELEDVQRVFGGDPEPTFWAGVVALRAGFHDLAVERLARAIAVHPPYAGLLESLHSAGRAELPPGGVAALLGGTA